MTTIITRLYAAEEHASNAASALKRKFGADQVNLVTPTNSEGADVEALAVKGGVRPAHAAVYADKVQQGHSLVTVHAPWGFAQHVIDALESHGPVDAGVAETEYHQVPYEATPFSNALGWSVLTKFKSNVVLSNDPAPFSAFLKWPTLFPSKSSAKLVNGAAPFSKALNLPVLSDQKPFSTLVKDDKSHVTLSNEATPFSNFFHIKVLSDD
jgi:hypothetical protein